MGSYRLNMQIGAMLQNIVFVNHEDATAAAHQLFKGKIDGAAAVVLDDRVLVDPKAVSFAKVEPCK